MLSPFELKLWCLKYGLYPRIAWPLAMYEVALTHVERFERKISGFIRKWLGLPPGVSNIAFYGQANKLLLPLTALTEDFKVEKVRKLCHYRTGNGSLSMFYSSE